MSKPSMPIGSKRRKCGRCHGPLKGVPMWTPRCSYCPQCWDIIFKAQHRRALAHCQRIRERVWKRDIQGRRSVLVVEGFRVSKRRVRLSRPK